MLESLFRGAMQNNVATIKSEFYITGNHARCAWRRGLRPPVVITVGCCLTLSRKIFAPGKADGKNSLKSFIIFTAHQLHMGDYISKDGMGASCSMRRVVVQSFIR